MGVPAKSQHDFLFDLPLAALYAVLHRAGPRSRELCRALLDLYGPLPRLTPRGVTSPDELLTALTSNDRHKQLASLDLSHLPNLLTEDNLQRLCKALPQLSALRLPDGERTLTAAYIAAATTHLPHLTALHVPSMRDMHAGAPPEWPITEAPPALQELTLPAALVASCATRLSGLTALSKLCFCWRQTGVVDVSHVTSLVAQLPALVALDLGYYTKYDSVAQLRRLTQLTALKLAGLPRPGEPTRQLLQHVGTLTNLRSLALGLMWNLDEEWDDAAPAWLSGLTRLTSLQVDFLHTPAKGLALDEVAASVGRLPALCQLRINDIETTGAVLSGAAWAHIASARSRLELLELTELALPPAMFTQILPQLTGLTSLHLGFSNPIPTPIPRGTITSFSWLAVLTALRTLEYVGVEEDTAADNVLPCQLLAGLPNVDTLALTFCTFVDAPYVEQLCEVMPQLTRLNLSGNEGMGVGLRALQRLTNLEVLRLAFIWYPTEVMGHVRAPLSLRRCCVLMLERWRGPEEQAHARAVLGRHVEAVFS